jgi:hypothetical protein
MAQLKHLLQKYKHGLVFWISLFLIVFFVEGLIFNQGFFFSKLFRLEERRYSMADGSLYQFKLVNEKLVAETNDPNITFNKVNLLVGIISIKCTNSVTEAVGQVFFRNNHEAFSEAHSVLYRASSTDKTFNLSQFFGLPTVVRASSLRFDLTNTPGDIVACDEIVVNPRIPFKLSSLRFAAYLSAFFLIILFKNGKTASIFLKSQKKIVYLLAFLALSVLFGIKFMPVAMAQHIIFIVALPVLLFLAAITCVLVYLFEFPKTDGNEEAFPVRYKHELGLVIVIIIAVFPLLTESFLYFDDWWMIGTNLVIGKEFLVMLGRPVQILLAATMNFVNIRNAFLFKWAFLPAVIFYAIILYRWLSVKTHDNVFSFAAAGILSGFAPVVDLLGYTSTSAFIYSVVFSALSVVCFEYAWKFFQNGEKQRGFIGIALSFALLFTALLTYQMGPQIIFIFLSIEIYFGEKIKALLKKYAAFLFLFAASYGFYMLFIKSMTRIYQVQLTTNRSQIVNSLSQVVGKINFYKLVLEQSIMQVIAAFSGNSLVMERYHGYIISFSDQLVGGGVFFVVVFIVFMAFVGYWIRIRSVLGVLTLLVFIPASDFVFLVLSESGYLTYYAFAHISLIMFYFIAGLVSMAQLLLGKTKPAPEDNPNKISPLSRVVAPLLVVCVLISNYYVRDFYVNYNSAVYNFVKYTIQAAVESGTVKRIHVAGLISPLYADVYSRFVAEAALKDLGENPAEYKITFSRSKYFLARIPEADYLAIKQAVSDSDAIKLDEAYVLDPTYRQYHIKTYPSKEDQVELQRIFLTAGAIPQISSPGTLIIDLTWTDNAYLNH